HGDETVELARELRSCLPQGVQLFKALRLREEPDLKEVDRFAFCDAIVCESAVPGVFGGAGVPGTWALPEKSARRGRVLLAGGVGPANVRRAIAVARPMAVDVCSGVEVAAGVKSSEALRRFFVGARDDAAA